MRRTFLYLLRIKVKSFHIHNIDCMYKNKQEVFKELIQYNRINISLLTPNS